MKKLRLLAFVAVGYVLGARAGRERYEQIKSAALSFWHNPTVQQKVDEAEDLAKERASDVGAKVVDAATFAGAKVADAASFAGTKVADKVGRHTDDDTATAETDVPVEPFPGPAASPSVVANPLDDSK